MADERNRVLGQERSEEERAVHAELAREAKGGEAEKWKSYEILKLLMAGDVGKSAVGARWVLTWIMVEGVTTVKARPAAKGFQDPDLKAGVLDTSGCVSLRSSHLQVISHCPQEQNIM